MVTSGTSSTPGLGLLAAALLLAAAGLLSDAGGRVLAWPVAILVALAGGRALLLRPVLHADAEALTVVAGLGRVTVSWREVERMRVVRDRRTPVLEIDLGTTLVVLSRLRLGRPPEAVLAELSALQR